MKKMLLGLLAAALLCLVSLTDALAASYRFTEKNGSVGIADDLASVPEPYRATAELIEADELEEEQATGAVSPLKTTTASANASAADPPRTLPDQNAATVSAVPAPSAPKEDGGSTRAPFSRRGAVSLGVVFGVLLIMSILGQIVALRVRHSALNAVRLSLLVLLAAYLAYAHSRDVIVLVRMAGNKVQDVSDRSAKRGEKVGKAIKAVETLADQVDEAGKQADEAQKGLHEPEPAADR